MQNLKETFSEKYFGGVKTKHIKFFETETPNKNIIKGFICKKPNRYLGSMVITEMVIDGNTYETEQFIHAMPKIHYYDYKHEMFDGDDQVLYPCYEKLDGSCLILFGLYLGEELVEVIPKTRGVPVADRHIIEMYNEIDHSNIETFFEWNNFGKENPTLLFELYGTLNLHSIHYPEVRISLGFIGGSLNGDLFDHHLKDYFSKQYDFVLPKKIFSLKKDGNFWKVIVHPGKFAYYLIKGMTEAQINGLSVEYPTQLDAITAIKDMITTINKNYTEVHKYTLLEGVCVNAYDKTGEKFIYLKIKSADIIERCKTQNGVPRKFIMKEAQKYFDEYGSNAKDIYKRDEDHGYNYIMQNLSEEFDKDALEDKKTKNRVRRVFIDLLDAKQPPKGLQDICNELVGKYPGQDVKDYMRLFAQEYPEKKRQASIAYSIFEKLA